MSVRSVRKPTPPANARLVLRLYVAGGAPISAEAVRNARALCDEHFAGQYQLEIIDVVEHPERGLADGILITPTLLRCAPLPVRRIVGNLAATDRVLSALREVAP